MGLYQEQHNVPCKMPSTSNPTGFYLVRLWYSSSQNYGKSVEHDPFFAKKMRTSSWRRTRLTHWTAQNQAVITVCIITVLLGNVYSTFWQFTSHICRGHFTSTLNICKTTFKSTGNYYPSPHPNQGNPIHQISQNVTSLAFLEQNNKKQPSVFLNFFWWDSGKSLLTDQQPLLVLQFPNPSNPSWSKERAEAARCETFHLHHSQFLLGNAKLKPEPKKNMTSWHKLEE